MNHTPAIIAKDLVREFPSCRAVDGVSIEIPTGIVFGFLGPNGAGKTTTIRLLLGLLEPTSGQAAVCGHDVQSESGRVRECCGVLLEDDGLYWELSAYRNLEFHARLWGLTAHERAERIERTLRELGFWERRDEPVAHWSRGMRRRLALARCMLHRPQVVFLDEPSAGLDPVATVKLRSDLAALAAEDGLTVFLTTHNLAEAEKLCHRVAVVDDGRIVADGTPQNLRGDWVDLEEWFIRLLAEMHD
jgi:ABC-2 type transport system ATP-binding protein